ncbi:phage tail tube protein [Escherichia coli]
MKGAGTTLWVYKGSGDPYANPLSDVDWSRLAKVKDLMARNRFSLSLMTTAISMMKMQTGLRPAGQKSAGDTSFTLAWMPGEQGAAGAAGVV